MRLWLDEMIPAEVARRLRDLRHIVQAVQDLENRWAWGLDDQAQLKVAVRQGRAIVTYNLRDFVPIAEQWAVDNKHDMGIILTLGLPCFCGEDDADRFGIR
jgi:predicted nuclease of predicted toxin-antitoxin system